MTLIAAILLILTIACFIGLIIFFIHKNKQLKEYENRTQFMYNDACLRIAEMERACTERIKQNESISTEKIRQEENRCAERIRQEENRITVRQRELDSEFAKMEEERIIREDISRKNDREVITELHVQLSRIDKDLKHIMPKIDNVKSYTEEVNNLSSNISSMKNDTQEIIKNFEESFQETIDTLYGLLIEKTVDVENMLSSSVDAFNGNLSGLMDEFATNIKEMEKNVVLSYDDVVRAVEDVWDDKYISNDYDSDLFYIKCDLDNLSSAISSLSSDISNIGSTISSLDSDISNIGSAISSLDSDVSNIDSEISSLECNISSIECSISSIEYKLP